MRSAYEKIGQAISIYLIVKFELAAVAVHTKVFQSISWQIRLKTKKLINAH